jgi:GNAT superfamily N-acetyltransferase
VRQSSEGRAPSGAPQGLVVLRRVEVVRTYLTLDDPAQLRAAKFADASARIERRSPCSVALYRQLYKDVGKQWYWHDRLEWSDAQLAAHLAAPNVGVWELQVNGESAGYFELQRHDDGSVEIVYFGLTPKFIGKGLGGPLLTRAVEEAWTMSAKNVWLHTCTLDSERALPNYRARGFREYKSVRLEVDIEGSEVVGERLIHD